MKIETVLGTKVIIQKVEKTTETTSSGIVVPRNRDARYAGEGIVKHVGVDVKGIAVGDKVLFQKAAGSLIGDDLYVINVVEIYCTYNED